MPAYIFALGCNARLSATFPNCAPIAAIRRPPWPRTFAYAPQSSLVRDPPGTVNKRTAATAKRKQPNSQGFVSPNMMYGSAIVPTTPIIVELNSPHGNLANASPRDPSPKRRSHGKLGVLAGYTLLYNRYIREALGGGVRLECWLMHSTEKPRGMYARGS